jgi:hypothetical protein
VTFQGSKCSKLSGTFRHSEAGRCDWPMAKRKPPPYRVSGLSAPKHRHPAPAPAPVDESTTVLFTCLELDPESPLTPGHTIIQYASWFCVMGQQSSQPSQHGGETQRLLSPDPEQVDHDGCFPPHGIHDICPANPHADLPVYVTIHRYVYCSNERRLDE